MTTTQAVKMKFEIKSRWSGSVLFSIETESMKLAVEAAVKARADLSGAYLRGADLRGAYLSGADLSGADLSGAYLSGAYLRGADLRGAYLSGAYLRGADLSGAYLSGAYLSGADLSGADLSGAYLRGADLSGAYLRGEYLGKRIAFDEKTVLPTGETFKAYLTEVVPALLVAGGKKLKTVATAKVWDCHTWTNCPMHAAFNANHLDEVPALLRPRAEQFIQLFDARLIPLPKVKA